ncbi:ribonuclease domain-containing protein [Pigmentiphaga sp.]|uniref:ribonuclease domain-containing protein n=1 Tax=Pigmentiphaga sp. TaxID=1977564 RepID=UPI0025FFD30D|nr:ribonuclease domain-containing protein [Pigmentiphaga sp.]
MSSRSSFRPARALPAVGRIMAWLAVGLLALVLGAAGWAAKAPDTISVRDLPPEAREVLAKIRAGHRFTHPRDGVTFYNRERLLPLRPRGYYTEYTVPTPGARNRGARRIVAGKGDTGDPATSGEYWYTSDHYASFRRIRE